MDRLHLTDEYYAYMASDQWALKRAAALARVRYTCQRCGGRHKLEVHHRTYERFGGDEHNEDLEVLCERCHDAEHRREDARRQWDARLDGWASKVYGDDWQAYHSLEKVEEAFDEWLGDEA